MSVTTDRVADIVAPVVRPLGLDLYDVLQAGGTLRVLLDRPGGVDVDTLAEATRAISSALDAADPVAGSYTLEVSSPGLERPLRTPTHFAGAVGEEVKLKLRPGVEGDRRLDGTLREAEGDRVTLVTEAGPRTVAVADITSAHTVFEWSPPPKPGRPRTSKRSAAHASEADPTQSDSTEDTHR